MSDSTDEKQARLSEDEPDTGAIVVTAHQLPQVQTGVAELDFAAIKPGDIVSLGLSAEKALHGTLDDFLRRLDNKTAAKVFQLFRRLEKGVEEADLPEVLKKVQEGDEPGFFANILNSLTGKTADDIAQEFMEEISALITGRTKTLADEMGGLEKDLQREMQVLFTELQALDALKTAYGEHFAEFTVQAAVANAFLQRAKAFVETEERAVQANDIAGQGRVRELQSKLQLLESRALALEGTYTRLPADQLVIAQIEQAGISTLQETATTIAARFASIKMTLLAIHGAFAVKAVQQLSQRQQEMDEQLTKLRNEALKDVAVTAARAPGDNRLAQAQQIGEIVTATAEIHDLIETASQENEQKFAQARQLFAEARAEMASLNNPNLS